MRAAVFICALAIALPTVAATPEEDFRSGEKAYGAGDVVGAMALLRRAADAGNPRAQSLYGTILGKAEYSDEALVYLRRAAEQGDAEGEYALGVRYAAGEGVGKDPAEAQRWLEAAARQGHPQAVVALSQAVMGAKLGFTTEAARAEGLPWVEKAADAGSVPALAYLASGYRSGAFGSVDLAKAERLEARLREIAPESRRKGRAKK